MTLIAYVFPKWQTVKNLVRSMSKKRRFRTPFNIQHAKESQTLAKSAWQHFFKFFHLSGEYPIVKCLCSRYVKSEDCMFIHWMSMIRIIFVIVRISRNQFKYKYLKNKKHFRNFWSIFEIYRNFWTFRKKYDPHSLCIFEIIEYERRA